MLIFMRLLIEVDYACMQFRKSNCRSIVALANSNQLGNVLYDGHIVFILQRTSRRTDDLLCCVVCLVSIQSTLGWLYLLNFKTWASSTRFFIAPVQGWL